MGETKTCENVGQGLGKRDLGRQESNRRLQVVTDSEMMCCECALCAYGY